MKTFEYRFKFKEPVYKYLMCSDVLNDYKQEKRILSVLVKGMSSSQIGNEIGYSARTIQRRKHDIFDKVKDLMF